MRSSLAISLPFVALLALSLAGKVAASNSAPKPDPMLFLGAADAALQQAGFATSFRRSELGPFVQARTGDCRIMVREITDGATYAEGARFAATTIGPTLYLYRGRMHSEPPNAVPLFEYYLWRGLHRLGIATARRPLAAIARSSGCEGHRIDWSPLAELPR